MLPDLLDALVRPAAYRRFRAEKAARTASYVAFLSMIFVGGLGVEIKLRLAPFITDTFAWFETRMPEIHYEKGVVTTKPAGPMVLIHPRAKELALKIDTARTEPVTAQTMKDEGVLAFLTGDAVYMGGGAEFQKMDLSKPASPEPVTIDASTYRGMEKAFDWVVYPSALLFAFLVFALMLTVFGGLCALAGLMMASLAGGEMGFAELFRIAVHAQTAGALLYVLDTVLPFALPAVYPLVALALSLTYTWLGVRSTVGAAAPPAA